MDNDIRHDVQLVMQRLDEVRGENNFSSEDLDEEEIFQVHHFPDAIVILKKPEPTIPTVESTPVANQVSLLPTVYVLCVALLLPLASIFFQLYLLSHPFTATVTLLTKAQQVTPPLGRLLSPIVLSQSQTAPTTGTGHQDAKASTGTVTFYNGLFTAQVIPAGTIFTGSDGVQVATDADITLPAANPPAFSIVSVYAHALDPGVAGNIMAGDISTTISNGVLVKNLGAFHGGKDARSYHTVSQDDINTLATTVQAQLYNRLYNSFGKQLQAGEVMTQPRCYKTTASNHKAGEEATQVQVTVKETCSASVYNLDRIKSFLAGKNTQAALYQLAAFGQVAISFSGFGDNTRLPKDTRNIHLIFIVQ